MKKSTFHFSPPAGGLTFNLLSRAFQSLITAFDAVRDWTDPAMEGSPYKTYKSNKPNGSAWSYQFGRRQYLTQFKI